MKQPSSNVRNSKRFAGNTMIRPAARNNHPEKRNLLEQLIDLVKDAPSRTKPSPVRESVSTVIPADLDRIITMNQRSRRIIQDYCLKVRYICARIPDNGIRINFTADRRDPVYAELTPLRDGTHYDLLLETNDPDWSNVNELYDYFRRDESLVNRWWKETMLLEPMRLYEQKVESLSRKQRKLFDAASETARMNAQQLTEKADQYLDGYTKLLLSFLVKLELFDGDHWAGYLKVKKPNHPYII